MGTAQIKDNEIYNIPITKTIAVPAAGAEITATVPTGKMWVLMGFKATLTTSATVNNRVPTLIFDDGTNEFLRLVGRTNIPASQTVKILGETFDVLPSDVANSLEYYVIPLDLELSPGFRITTSTTNLDTTDAYTAIYAIVKEYDTITQ